MGSDHANLSSEEACRLLSRARLASFSDSVSLDEALSICTWEIELRSVLLKPINIMEVFLRNSLDCAIRQWWQNSKFPEDWLDEREPEEYSDVLDNVCNVKQWRKKTAKITGKSADQVTRDDIIAHTMYGTWKNMVGNPLAIGKEPAPREEALHRSWEAQRKMNERTAELWKEVTHTAFPNVPTKSGRKGLSPHAYIGTRISRIGALRNRICHWDSILKVDVVARYRDMLDIVGAISDSGLTWFQEQTEHDVYSVLDKRPSILDVKPSRAR